jgi:predicted lipoprotein
MKLIRYIIIAIIIGLVAYNSVYFKKLDEVKASHVAKEFNAAQYATTFWDKKLIPSLNKAIEITRLSAILSSDPGKAFNDWSHALGIGNLRYFLISGKGVIESVDDDYVAVLVQGDSSKQVTRITTEYIFGNAVRDATGLININEFTNTMDFNNVSAEINKIIREKVLPAFKQKAKKGSAIEFTGAIELNKEHPALSGIEIIPIKIMIGE